MLLFSAIPDVLVEQRGRAETITFTLHAASASIDCPCCGTLAERIQSCYISQPFTSRSSLSMSPRLFPSARLPQSQVRGGIGADHGKRDLFVCMQLRTVMAL